MEIGKNNPTIRAKLELAVERGKNWLLRNQITSATESYDQFRLLSQDGTKGQWYEIPTPEHLHGAFYANLVRNDPHATSENEVRRQYYNTWHTAQAGVALLNYLEYRDEPEVRHAVESAWGFIQRHQITDGEYAGVYVEVDPAEIAPPLKNVRSLGHNNPDARKLYADYDNIETDLFPLELYRCWNNQDALAAAKANADFYLRKHMNRVLFEVETETFAISGMSNDAVYGRLFLHTGEDCYREIFQSQLQRLNEIGLDLRAGNNIRNLYWDATACAYAVEHFPDMKGPAMAKLAFLGEHLLAGQKENGVLWFRFRQAGVPDDSPGVRTQDGAATYAAMLIWGTLYDQTGDQRWLEAIRQGASFALTQQYPDDYGPEFAGAFQYAASVTDKATGKQYESLRDISTIFALRALIPLLRKKTPWTQDFWQI